MPVGNIPGWNQVYADDFANQNVPIGQFPTAVSGQWKDYPDGSTDTTGNGTYMPSQVVSIHNGMMDLYLHTANGVHLVAAPEPVIPNAPGSDGGLLYGRYEIRFMADAVPGYKTAWLLWPDSNVWNDGEIDFPEANLNSTITASMHHVGDPQVEEFYTTNFTYSSWHTAIIQWTPQSVIFTMDGQVIGDDTNASLIASTPMHWVLQTETQLTGGPPSDSASGHVYIAWVTAYARA
jgi:beta-glucanase (GH16 family)